MEEKNGNIGKTKSRSGCVGALVVVVVAEARRFSGGRVVAVEKGCSAYWW